MKRFYISFWILLAVFSNTFGQTLTPYPPAGLIQGELYDGPWTNPGLFDATIKYLGDTVISTYTYSLFSNEHFGHHYTRYDNGKIYSAYRNIDRSVGPEILKYDFNLALNDTFPSQTVGGNFIVDSISTVTLLNGQVRKYIRLKDYYLQNHHWVDGLGDIERGFLYQIDIEGGFEQFLCARDISGLLYINPNLSLDCDSLTGYVPASVGSENFRPDFEISPCPAFEKVDLHFHGFLESELDIQLFNSVGQVLPIDVSSRNAGQATLNIKSFEPGIYYVRVSSLHQTLVKKLFVL